jgi:oxygen-independent coproporphyrinogen III oxidase
MQILFENSGSTDFGIVDHTSVKADYVYMYPPRQAYREMQYEEIASSVQSSIDEQGSINLYVHFPFCSQICAYCNLYVSGSLRAGVEDAYINAVLHEIDSKRNFFFGKRLSTIYLGGGTPSLLSPRSLGKVLDRIAVCFDTALSDIQEVALEVAPETATWGSLVDFRSIGVNRINLGIQSTSNAERLFLGRRSDSAQGLKLIDSAMLVGFKNVCVDLIYGLQGQTDLSWLESLRNVASLSPETVCTYALTLRPKTGFSAKGYINLSASTAYARYEMGLEVLTSSGYSQENHVRYIKGDNGGYVQKKNHWAGENIVGIGAGARSTLKYCDLRNGYSIRERKRVLEEYLSRSLVEKHVATEGIALCHDERARRRIILGLFDLDSLSFASDFGQAPQKYFPEEIAFLVSKDLLTVTTDRLFLTKKGRKFRDNIAQMFFSENVKRLVVGYDYDH